MSATAEKLPNIQEELDRKAVDFLQEIEWKASEGIISHAEYMASMQALWQITSGLVGQWLVEFYSYVKFNEQDQSLRERRVFSKEEKVVIVESIPRNGQVKILSFNGGTFKETAFELKDELQPAVACRKKIASVASGLKTMGFREHD